jgi:nucleoside-diphosphate-sugar epimerase
VAFSGRNAITTAHWGLIEVEVSAANHRDTTWFGGRGKAPAAICRKMMEAQDTGSGTIDIWGDGSQTRSFCFIDDCVLGIDQIMHCDRLIATPINLGSSELISINDSPWWKRSPA